MSSFQILDAFVPDVPLGVRTLRKRFHMKKGPILAAIHEQIRLGRIRRVEPSEVGSNKYSESLPPKWDIKQLHGTRKWKTFRRHQVDVFVLV